MVPMSELLSIAVRLSGRTELSPMAALEKSTLVC